MSQRSFFWGGRSVGDAALPAPYGAPYSDDIFTDVLSNLLVYDRTTQGVIPTALTGYTGGLAVTNPAGTTIRVATGMAIVDGKLYTNDANIDLSTSGDGGYSVVLRKDFAAQTVRAAIRATGVTQNDGTTWEIKLADVTVAGGVHTVSDQRAYTWAVTQRIADLGVTTAKINNDAVTTAKILDANVTPAKLSFSTWVRLAQTTLGANGQITLSSIPSGYTALKIIGSFRSMSSGGGLVRDGVMMRFNGDSTAANYMSEMLATDESAPFSDFDTALDGMKIGTTSCETQDSHIFSVLEVTIPLYTSTSIWKSARGSSSVNGDAIIGTNVVASNGGTWMSTAAITSILFLTEHNDSNASRYFKAGSSVTLYGIT